MTNPNDRPGWARHLTRDALAGLVSTFALIPEVIAFAYVAGIDPQVGLFSSFVISVVISVAGGRPAMVSAAAGSVALVVVLLVREHGVAYLLAATVLAGLIQIGLGLSRLAVLMRFVSRSVVAGFVNALAILIFSAQVPELIGVGWQTYALVALGLAIIYGLPRITTVVPSPLVSIAVVTLVSIGAGLDLRTVGDLGALPNGLPAFAWPAVPLSLETLGIVAPYAVAIAFVGLLETLMTAGVVDEMTDSASDKDRESTGLGLANVAAGLFGGIAGCAMIGQTVGNVKYGGRGRVSTFCAGFFLLVLMVALKPWVARIPMAALVAVMIAVSVATFSWSSLRDLVRHPKLSGAVMLATAGVTVASHNLALGVLVGVLLSGAFFAFKVARLVRVGRSAGPDGVPVYAVSGQIFFASAETVTSAFAEVAGVPLIRIDLTSSHVWDVSAIAALDRVVARLSRQGTEVELIGLNEASADMVERLSTMDRRGAAEPLIE